MKTGKATARPEPLPHSTQQVIKDMTDIEDDPEFYKSLALLFYAVAMADNHTKKEEKQMIYELMLKEWSQLSNKVDSRQIVFSTLKELFEQGFDKEEAFLAFKVFYQNNQSRFSKKLVRAISHSASKIAGTFAGINKSESVLIGRLHFLMERDEPESSGDKA